MTYRKQLLVLLEGLKDSLSIQHVTSLTQEAKEDHCFQFNIMFLLHQLYW